MALFCVHRYVGEEEKATAEDLEKQSQALLQRLQDRARVQQLQKKQQEEQTAIATPRPARREITGLDNKEEPKKRKRRPTEQEYPRAERQGKPKKILQASQEKGSSLSSRRHKKPKNGGESKRLQGQTEAGSDKSLRHPLDGKGSSKSRARERPEDREEPVVVDQTLNEEEMPPSSSMIILGGYDQKAVQKVQPVLPQWLAQPKPVKKRIKENLTALEDVPGIHPKLVKKLQANGIHSLFPVQAEVIPAVLESVTRGLLTGKGGYRPSDICVSAPTGSGKTLAFVIPVVQALLERVVCQVRVLAVLPTKELAQQVSKVFNIYTNGTGLKVVQLTGQKPFAKEQEHLVEKTLTGFRSLADIVVATPGRLVDHLQQTPQFSLRELRFLIIDEADRMIDGMHQDWLQQVVTAAYRGGDGPGPSPQVWRAEPGPLTAARASCPQLPLQKLLFSATLTQNPEKLQQLSLYQPCLFTSVHSEKGAGPTEAHGDGKKKYTLPEGLSQYYVPCTLSSKPLFLLHFLLRLKFTRVLCFTNSKDTSHRLFLLIQAFGSITVAEFSSRLSPGERRRTLKEFERGKIQLLICTDAVARGIDIGGVKYIISYDAPQFIRTYIHRVGRTARAGKAGLAFTMVLKAQEHKFLNMLKEAGLPQLERQLVKSECVKPLLQPYEVALAELQNHIKEERAKKRT